MIDEDKKIKKQAFDISSALDIYNPCKIKDKYIDSLDKVSTPILRDILSQQFKKGADMKAIFCLFNNIFSSLSSDVKEDGIYVLTKEVKKYIKDFKILISGTDGIVYNATFFSDIELIIKLPINEEGEDKDENERQNTIKRDMTIREYYIGVKAMNKLRYIVPNFVYTFGCFMFDNSLEKFYEDLSVKKNPFIVYEKIPGVIKEDKHLNTVRNLIDNKINFNQWLVIFFQLLLALEVAQREVEFTHFDLHFDNVMIRKQDNFEFSLPLDMSTYTIKNPEFIPVIIDFGRSTCIIDDKTIGAYGFEGFGVNSFVLNHMVPGQDMYMFISFCCNQITDIELKKKIASIITDFYGSDHPDLYTIKFGKTINTRTQKIREFANIPSIGDFFRKVPVTAIGRYTPLMFMNWLLDKYSDDLSPFISVTKREIYKPLQYSIMIKKYNDIFNYVEKGINKSIGILMSFSIGKRKSYVISKHICKLLQTYNKDLKSVVLKEKIKDAKQFLSTNKDILIFFDKKMLNKVFDIKIQFDQEELDKAVSDILNLNIYLPYETRSFVIGGGKFSEVNYTFELEPIQEKTKKLYEILEYEDKLKVYLQFYFTILNLNLQDEFNDWISTFESSKIYRFYMNNYVKNEQARRWAKTLLISSKNNERL